MLPCLTFNNSQNDLIFFWQAEIQPQLIVYTLFLLHAQKKLKSLATFTEDALISSSQGLCVWLYLVKDLVPDKYGRQKQFSLFILGTTSSSSLIYSRLNIPIPREQRWKEGAPEFQQDMKNKKATWAAQASMVLFMHHLHANSIWEQRAPRGKEWEAAVFSLSIAPVLSLQMHGRRPGQQAKNQKETGLDVLKKNLSSDHIGLCRVLKEQ